MTLWDEMYVDGQGLVKEFGRPVQFRGNSLHALVGANPLAGVYEDGGVVMQSSFNVRFLVGKSDLLRDRPPKDREHLTVYGREYIILSVTDRYPSPWIDCQVQASSQ